MPHTLDFLPILAAHAEADQMKELIEAIAKALVDHPEQVQVCAVEGEQVTVLRNVAPP